MGAKNTRFIWKRMKIEKIIKREIIKQWFKMIRRREKKMSAGHGESCQEKIESIFE